ncbi:(deoxy)nucleoside triphosphate pyrophosphohydrolase [uncultured Jatrophihabitans sp.]|uniref:(deoxy)nucleoside triphosphate pyrophosphohydrolase n=1 Tax=uncultured Jatrophihabitans sp. TaxID=1610747 RepID=UPI0035CC9938
MTEPARVAVVAAAIVADGRVLAARRSRPAALAGRWEFPGGKREPGEDDVQALVRECREELGITVSVGARLGSGRDGDVDLALYLAVVERGTPAAGEDHDELRWLDDTTLSLVDWLPVDAALLDAVRPALR